MRIVWLASYPKSGNTWVRYFLYSYLVGPVPSTSHLGSRIPDVHVKGQPAAAQPIDGRLFVKTHFLWTAKHPAREHTEGFVYILRNPKDTMLSNLNYRRLTASSAESLASVDPRAYAHLFLQHGGDPFWRSRGFGTWAEHAASWLSDVATPRLVVRYEALKANPTEEFRRILEFLKVQVDPDRLDAAVKGSSFDQMRAMEIRSKRNVTADVVFGGSTRLAHKNIYFMNKGQSGQSLSSIDPRLDEAYDQAFGPAMSRLGYSSEPGGEDA